MDRVVGESRERLRVLADDGLDLGPRQRAGRLQHLLEKVIVRWHRPSSFVVCHAVPRKTTAALTDDERRSSVPLLCHLSGIGAPHFDLVKARRTGSVAG